MNVNNFYREVFEDSLGLDVLGLESRYPELVQLIDRKTLPAFSAEVPARYYYYLDTRDTSRIIKKDHNTLGVEYWIDDPILDKFNLPILGIESIEYNDAGLVDPYDPDSTAFYNSVIASRQNITLESVLMGSEYTYSRTLIDTALPFKRYQELRGPRTIYLKNWSVMGTIEIVFKTCWPNVVSIPEEYKEVLVQLAKYDIRIKLWNELRYIEDVVTPAGNLSLRINDWESAEKDREEFLKDLKSRAVPDKMAANYFSIL